MKRLYWFFPAAIIIKTILALTVPVSTDEAYYADWANYLDLGYFDHPPMVALWTWPTTWGDAPNLFSLRFLSLLSGLLCFYVSYRWYGSFKNFVSVPASLLILWGSFAGLLYGVLVTPDVPLLLFWVLALLAAQKALQGRPSYWLLAGLATGLGLLSKYTMAVMGLVFLWALIKNPKQLKSPWPYLGGCLAFAVFAFNIYWNYQHQWITFNFQLKHGIDAKRSEMLELEIPRAQKPPVAAYAFQESIGFYDSFWDAKKPETTWSQWKRQTPIRQLLSLSEYMGGLIGLFGLLGILALIAMFRKSKETISSLKKADPLLLAAAVVPLLFFGIFALLGNSEANWAAMACFGMAPLMAKIFDQARPSLQRAVRVSLVIHLFLLAGIALHSAWPLLPVPPHKDRLRKETAGYKELSDYLKQNPLQVYADKYQITAMLNFYAPELAVKQWPGVTRDSDYTFREERRITNGDLERLGGLTLVTSDMPAPYLDEYRLQRIVELSVCMDHHKAIVKPRQIGESRACDSPIRRLFAVDYEKIQSLPSGRGL